MMLSVLTLYIFPVSQKHCMIIILRLAQSLEVYFVRRYRNWQCVYVCVYMCVRCLLKRSDLDPFWVLKWENNVEFTV